MKTAKKYTIIASLSGLVSAVAIPALAAAPTSLKISSLDGTPSNPADIISTITNTLLYAAGIISVIMIIVGGIMYSLSAGDSSKGTKAKDTILYAVIGLVITTLAYAIVNFVIKTFK